MKNTTRLERQQEIHFAVGMAALDGGKPTDFTKSLLHQYEAGQMSAQELKQAIVQKYARPSN